jgi:lipoprotein-releasing system permease protein
MDIRLILSISRTHLLSRKKQSIIAALGVTFGIGTYIIMMGFMNGLNGLLDGLILNRTPHIHLYNEIQASQKQPIDLNSSYLKRERFVRSVKPIQRQTRIHNAIPLIHFLEKQAYSRGVTAQIRAQAFYLGGSIQLNGSITGVDVMKEAEWYNLGDYIVEGTCHALESNENGILLGAGVAKKLSLKMGDVVQLSSTKGEISKRTGGHR